MAVKTIATRLVLDGEAEYRAKLKNINAELALQKSELEKIQAQYKNNANGMEALSAKQSALAGRMAALNEKHREQSAMLDKAREAQQKYADEAESLRAKLEDLKTSSADTAEEEEKLAKKLASAEDSMQKAANAVTAYQKQLNYTERDQKKLGEELERTEQYLAEAADSADGCAKSIDELGRTTKQAGEDADSFSSKFKDGFSVALKGTGAAVGAVATAAAAGIKVLNDIAAATEEYRENQGKLNTAFEAAGYSTETAKAAYQDLYAVLGDSDNATESAQLLAKLAKSEEDVAKWGEIAAGVTGTFGDALPINSLIEASNETAKVGQVTGTLADALNWVGISEDEFNEKLAASADEAERTKLITETLSSAYQNASDIFRENNEILMEANRAQAEMDESMSKLGGAIAEVKTELTAEFAPALSEVMDALAGLAEGTEGADQAFTQAIDHLIGQATEKLPELLEFGADIIINVISGMANASPQLAEGAVAAITALVEGLTGALPQMSEAAAQLIGGLVSGLAEAAPELIPAAANAIAEVAQALVDNAPFLLDAALQLITALGDGLLEAIPVLLEATPEIISSLLDAILEGIPQIIETGITLLSSLVEDLPAIISTVIEVLPQIISSISNTLLDNIPKIIEAGVELLTALVTDLPKIIAEIVSALPEIITGMVAELAKGISKFEDVGGNLVRGLWTGIQSLASWLWNKVYGWINSIWDGITDFFGIASPSKEMAWIGEMLVEGLAGAVNKDGKKAVKAVKDMASDMLSEVQAETGKVNGILTTAAGQAVQRSTQDIEKELRRQKELIASEDAAYQVGRNNVLGLVDGTANPEARQALIREYQQMAKDALAAYRREVDQHSPSRKFNQTAQYDVQGLIEGVEAKRASLAAAYGDLAKLAMESYAGGVRSNLEAVAEAMAQFDAAAKDLDSFYDLQANVRELEYQLWERTEGKNASEAEKYARQLELLRQKQAEQQEVVDAAAAAYQAAVEQYGEGTEGSYQYQQALLQERLALQELLEEIEKVTAAKKELERQAFLEQVKARWESSGTGQASAAAWAAGYTTPYEVAQIAGIGLTLPDGTAYAPKTREALDARDRHQASFRREPPARGDLGRQMERISAAAVNAFSSAVSGMSGGTTIVKVMIPNGDVLAEVVADPLVDRMDANGTPIVNRR